MLFYITCIEFLNIINRKKKNYESRCPTFNRLILLHFIRKFHRVRKLKRQKTALKKFAALKDTKEGIKHLVTWLSQKHTQVYIVNYIITIIKSTTVILKNTNSNPDKHSLRYIFKKKTIFRKIYKLLSENI